MSGLGEAVWRLAERDGVEAALLASSDGLHIESAARGALEPDTVAALAATLGRQAVRLGEGARQGELLTTVLEYENGLVVLAALGPEGWLALLTRSDADLGGLLYDLRQHRPALAALL